MRNITKITLILVYLVIVAGATVRMTGSGMGCPDWPKCFGYLVPPTERAQLEWQPDNTYKKGQVIIVDETLRVAKKDFVTTDAYLEHNWSTYTKHNYAVFNAFHTWTEFINRLIGALAGIATFIMAIVSLQYWKKNRRVTILSWITVLGMGFQAWLGATVVYSVLEPVKITLHMVMALVIVALILYILYSIQKPFKESSYNPLFKNSIIFALLLTLIQIVLGTQVRQYVDTQIDVFGETAKDQWLTNPTLQFYLHRSFSVMVLAVNAFLFYMNRKKALGYSLMNWVIIVLFAEILSGIIMYYNDFPIGSQAVHLVLASILFGVQFYIFLEVQKSKYQVETL
ncbi:COX15/CtaA family protein [Leptobacterium sp. I13]|uniref:COX15/CtaA family protein n=1 Tax=Leptobacterium meishanense TaxID=3128904 RepID=UPI0030EB2823